ncbi:uncharacterized protein BP5553_09130 [Venustampulla echinocandica]|uniref:Uncharacterized protein n=1 Tax=Venustampulla echinocandica TaxID=2656787 RepID=A0A370TDZ1_9HELO|nr:uncharacterized protein BP5553_09130 [Venustampulla echinocandica]RDL32674.1 hypothetical protein BP5553_09130 [Venustampulla echinocandica]
MATNEYLDTTLGLPLANDQGSEIDYMSQDELEDAEQTAHGSHVHNLPHQGEISRDEQHALANYPQMSQEQQAPTNLVQMSQEQQARGLATSNDLDEDTETVQYGTQHRGNLPISMQGIREALPGASTVASSVVAPEEHQDQFVPPPANLTCGNCGQPSHSVQMRLSPLDDGGFINACPWCNTNLHNAATCTRQRRTTREARTFFIVKRYNKPPIRCPWDLWDLDLDAWRRRPQCPQSGRFALERHQVHRPQLPFQHVVDPLVAQFDQIPAAEQTPEGWKARFGNAFTRGETEPGLPVNVLYRPVPHRHAAARRGGRGALAAEQAPRLRDSMHNPENRRFTGNNPGRDYSRWSRSTHNPRNQSQPAYGPRMGMGNDPQLMNFVGSALEMAGSSTFNRMMSLINSQSGTVANNAGATFGNYRGGGRGGRRNRHRGRGGGGDIRSQYRDLPGGPNRGPERNRGGYQ